MCIQNIQWLQNLILVMDYFYYKMFFLKTFKYFCSRPKYKTLTVPS